MSRFAINPNALPDPRVEESAALDRENAHLHLADSDNDAEGAELPPAMLMPDPRYPHGAIDAIEARLADLKAAMAVDDAGKMTAAPARPESEAAPPKPPEAPAVPTAVAQQGVAHPLVVSLISALPPPHTVWPQEERTKWLKAAESIFGLVYAG